MDCLLSFLSHEHSDVQPYSGGGGTHGHCVFSRFYQIGTGDRNDCAPTQSGSDRERRIEGLNSPWGNRGAILEHFGWTYEYLLCGVAWVNVQLMLADAARMKDRNDEEKDKPKKMQGDEMKSFFARHNSKLIR